MKDENELGIRLNVHGVTDVDYYIAQAHKQRSEAIGRGFKAFRTWLVTLFDRSQHPEQAQTQPHQPAVHSNWPWVDMILQGTSNRKIRHV